MLFVPFLSFSLRSLAASFELNLRLLYSISSIPLPDPGMSRLATNVPRRILATPQLNVQPPPHIARHSL